MPRINENAQWQPTPKTFVNTRGVYYVIVESYLSLSKIYYELE